MLPIQIFPCLSSQIAVVSLLGNPSSRAKVWMDLPLYRPNRTCNPTPEALNHRFPSASLTRDLLTVMLVLMDTGIFWMLLSYRLTPAINIPNQRFPSLSSVMHVAQSCARPSLVVKFWNSPLRYRLMPPNVANHKSPSFV